MNAKTPDLDLNATFDREMSWWRGGSCRYLVIEIAARTANAIAERPSHDLGIAIDASSSMGSALSSVQHLAKGLVGRLSGSDRIAIVSFADEALTELPSTPADEAGKDLAHAAIDGIKIRPGTDFTQGWLAAAEQVAATKEEHPADFAIVIVASDGKATRGQRRPEEVARYAADLRQRGISTAAVAPGPECDLSLLVAVDDPEGLQEQFGVAGGEQAVDALATNCLKLVPEIAKDVEVCVIIPLRTEVEILGTTSSERSGERLVCSLGNIRAGSRRLLVLKVILPEAEIGTIANFAIELSWTDQSGCPQRIGPIVRTQTFARGRDNTPQKRDLKTTLIVLAQWQRKVLQDLISLNRQGRLRDAEHYLAQEMKFLERYAYDVPASQELLQGLRLALPAVYRPWRERAEASAADRTSTIHGRKHVD